jgi:hypothetical protein
MASFECVSNVLASSRCGLDRWLGSVIQESRAARAYHHALLLRARLSSQLERASQAVKPARQARKRLQCSGRGVLCCGNWRRCLWLRRSITERAGCRACGWAAALASWLVVGRPGGPQARGRAAAYSLRLAPRAARRNDMLLCFLAGLLGG